MEGDVVGMERRKGYGHTFASSARKGGLLGLYCHRTGFGSRFPYVL